MFRHVYLPLGSLLIIAACGASTPGARPTDMSASAHESVASAHESEASTHASQYKPEASAERTQCGGAKLGVPCWTSISNPTAEHLKDAEAHKKMAADHRAAAKALRDAEATACAGLADADRDESPFSHREDITLVERLESAVASGKGMPSARLMGASVDVRAVPGLTKEYLQRVVDCHVARNAAMGFTMKEMSFCPLSVKGARATVESHGGAFRVEIRADDVDAAKEILERAQALGPKR